MSETRPERSWLFAPGTNARMCEKALTAGADRVILDLEDAVALDAKPAARAQVRGFLDRLGDGAPPVYVRVNGTATGLLETDVTAVVGPHLAGIVFPMAETGAQVQEVDRLIGRAEASAGLDAGKIEVVCLIETAAGLLGARDVARGAKRVTHLGFGAGDLCGDLGIPTTNEGPHILHGKVQTVWASRAAGIGAPLDTVYFDLQNPAGLEADCRQAKELGFGGKAVIHPSQVEPVNRLLAPGDTEIEQAHRIVQAFRKAEAEGTGAIRVDGKLIDYAMLKSAEKILAVATTLGRHPA
jgi:citrate lyase subunit beta/citryl-CoA lyase